MLDAALLDDEVCAQLKTPFEGMTSPAFRWRDSDNDDTLDFSQPVPTTAIQRVLLGPSSIDPAGEDEIALCNHNVTVKYNPTMEECHAASRSGGSTVQLDLKPGTITLKVGDELEEEEEEEEDDDDDDDEGDDA